MRAASSISEGSPRMKFMRMTVLYTGSAVGRTSDQMVSLRPSFETTRYKGIIPPLMSIVKTK